MAYQSGVCNLLSTPRCESQVSAKETYSLSCFGRDIRDMLASIYVLRDCLDLLQTERFPKYAGAMCSREVFFCVNNAESITLIE